jgi:hypothetical protein
MGREALCTARIGRKTVEGRLLLETDDLIFRGDPRLSVPLRSIVRARADNGWLEVEHDGGRARFDLGDAAEKWAHAINNPRSRIDKLDVKPDSRVAVVGIDDAVFLDELEARTGQVPARATGRDHTLIFRAADRPAALRRLESLRGRIVPAGAIWVITPKGKPVLGREPVIHAARDAGLVDVKSARFSDSHTALKLMIPKNSRKSR